MQKNVTQMSNSRILVRQYKLVEPIRIFLSIFRMNKQMHRVQISEIVNNKIIVFILETDFTI